MPEPSPRGAPSRQEPILVLESAAWTMPMRVVATSLDLEGRLRIRLSDDVSDSEVTVEADWELPPRVGQRLRVALFDLEGGE